MLEPSNPPTVGRAIEIFSTCPASSAMERSEYLQHVINVARWSEANGCTGILVYTDNSLVDAWLVSQIIIQNTHTLCPLVAIQPVYMHPYTVAKMVSSIGHLYGRRLYLNMVAGGFKNDLNALNDPTPHDKRYDRLVEYTRLITLLLGSSAGVTYDGEYYQIRQLKLTPALPSGLFPGVMMSGSSAAGLAAAKAVGAIAVKYPEAPEAEAMNSPEPDLQTGIRIGILARPSGDDAWAVAHERFPEDRKGQLTHQLTMKVSDSEWHRQLSQLAGGGPTETNPYWLVPFQNYKTFCPYLVGSYPVVAREVARYIRGGHRTFILDVPADKEELYHVGVVMKEALGYSGR